MALVVPAVMSLRMDLHSHCIWGCMWGWSCVQRCTVVWWLAPLPHSKRVPGSTPGWGLSVWSLHVLLVYVWVLSGSSDFLPPSKNVRLIGVSTILSLGVSVSVCLSRLSLCGPVMAWRPVQGVPDDRRNRLQPPRDRLSRYTKWMDGNRHHTV